MDDTLTEQVCLALCKVKRIPREDIAPESTLESLHMDSLDTITLMFELEESLGVTIPDDQVRGIATVHDIIEGMRRLKDGASTSSSPNAPATAET